MSGELKTSNARRKLLKSLATGGGVALTAKSLPEKWAKPVVDSVILPVHAQTTKEEPAPERPRPRCEWEDSVRAEIEAESIVIRIDDDEWRVFGSIDALGVITLTDFDRPGGCSEGTVTLTDGLVVGWETEPTGVEGTLNISEWVCVGGEFTCTSAEGWISAFNDLGDGIFTGTVEFEGSRDCCDIPEP